MLRIFNSLTRKVEPFRSARQKPIRMYSCGPSIYLKPHIGNYRTFIFEDLLQRYLEHLDCKVIRLMTVTDIEDKAIAEAIEEHTSLQNLTDANMNVFLSDLRLLNVKFPAYMPRSSSAIDSAVELIEVLLKKKLAYWWNHDGRRNVYFDPLKFKKFGKLSRLNMHQWPKTGRHFHLDTYPGTPWNKGDFILWHGYREGDKVFCHTALGEGRPAWNIQDAAMVAKHLGHHVDFACGGIDNLVRHHDYTLAIMESAFGGRFARYWCHGAHLLVDGKKMSKSRGNAIYLNDLVKKGYSPQTVRFFLMYGCYRERLNFTFPAINEANKKLNTLRSMVQNLRRVKSLKRTKSNKFASDITGLFRSHMNNDLDVKHAFDTVYETVANLYESGQNGSLSFNEASNAIQGLHAIDGVLQIIF